ncbi:YheC/YheD family protein [Paenisporosarcina sp. TG20]|uniref:YheC/YheD family endospore coat-associated protein n=1 Tax=Paenisporosarcina sp. TG20 TaxID=1211706 RepID=UPI0002E6DD5D|nr:YheC/YheD family protein [Paenisporosarcina sp. TG20]
MNNKNELLKGTVENDLVQDSFMIGILVGKSNSKLKRSLNHLKDLGGIYKNVQLGAFSLKGINSEKQIISGYLYNQGLWKRSIFPIPDAIINRTALNSTWESFFRETLGSRMITNFTFNKWEMYNWLSNDFNLSKHLPITRLVNCPQDIIDFLGEYKEGYIKPISGSFGRGIYKVSNNEENFLVEDSSKKHTDILSFNTEELKDYFTSKCKKRNYIIQQVIDLCVVKRPIDFRLILLKDAQGEWKDLGIIARKASKNGIVSNIGSVKRGNSALQNLLSLPRLKAVKIRKKMTQLSINAAKEMEKYGGYNGNLGNIGFDLGIDKNHNLWIIEMNHLNPQHRMAVEVGDDGIYIKTNEMIIDYAVALAEDKDIYLPESQYQ